MSPILNTGDKITVWVRTGLRVPSNRRLRLRHATVLGVSSNRFVTFTINEKLDGVHLDLENVRWIRGHHAANSKAVRALLSVRALSR